MNTPVDERLLAILRCPVSGQSLMPQGEGLATPDGVHRYGVVSGIPCLIPATLAPTHRGYVDLLADNRLFADGGGVVDDDVDAFINAMIVPTGGNLFRGAKLANEFPIGSFPKAFAGNPVLDIGCNWGRWTVGGALAGYTMVGVDLHLRALLCAQRLGRRLAGDRAPLFVLADARALPFAPASFGGAFSYSVLQHMSTEVMTAVLDEIRRVLRPSGQALVQMPNRAGLRSFTSWATRGFSGGREFDVRFYSIAELLRIFSEHIGPSGWSVDCFLGLNVHAEERRFMAPSRRWIVDVAEALRGLSARLPPLRRLADSVFISATKP